MKPSYIILNTYHIAQHHSPRCWTDKISYYKIFARVIYSFPRENNTDFGKQ
jgi:hypothetical protein